MANSLTTYLETYRGKELLKKHGLDERGLWLVKGEDPNCDLGGAHYEPTLGYLEGTLGEVIETGIAMPGFWQWGGGGSFTLIKPMKATMAAANAKRRAELEREIVKLQKELKDLS